MKKPYHVLAIETSCDETACAIIRDGRHVVSNTVNSQIDLHRRFGGVVPEVASRQHMHTMLPVVEEALRASGVTWQGVDAIAVTRGPGLAGSLLVGLNTAKTIAFVRGLPLIGVNHMEAHIYGNWLMPDTGELAQLRGSVGDAGRLATGARKEPRFPLLCLIVSGGHTELVLVRGHGAYALVGQTRDDAAGEAFDKVARLLGLPYPGGPSIQRAAQGGRADAYALPRGLARHGYEFSFSGLKTAVARLLETTRDAPIEDVAASFEQAVVDVLVAKTMTAARELGVEQIALAGGVAANLRLRRQFVAAAHVPVWIPPLRFCTDNAAMVGSAAYYNLRTGNRSDMTLDIEPGLRLVTEKAAF